MVRDILKKMGLKHRFRDPIYGFINLSEKEIEIVDTPVFQRLRRIHQLALEKYAFPGAEHSRSGHSLGVLHTATELFVSIFSHLTKTSGGSLEFTDNLSLYLKQLRYAALLHDIGHLPFSHGIEKELLPGDMKHESVSAFIIEKHPVISQIIGSDGISADDVISLIKPQKSVVSSESAFLKMFISGHFDADRADYLLRDSYYCGVKYGVYDFDRYLSSMMVKSIEEPEIMVKSDDVPIIEEFLMARYQYNIQVVYHRTRVMYNIALQEFIRSEKKNNGGFYSRFNEIFKFGNDLSITDIDFNKYDSFDDYAFFVNLDKYQEEDYWAQCLKRNRNHLTMLVERVQLIKEANRRHEEIREVLKQAGLVEEEDYFLWSAKLNLHELDSEKKPINVMSRDGKNLGPIDDYSILFGVMEQKTGLLWRIYVKSHEEEKKELISKKIEHIV